MEGATAVGVAEALSIFLFLRFLGDAGVGELTISGKLADEVVGFAIVLLFAAAADAEEDVPAASAAAGLSEPTTSPSSLAPST